MPMNTTCDTRTGVSCCARTTCSTISPASRWRSKPAWPVAQNVQPIAQPACDETHTVARSALRISTVSTCAPSPASARATSSVAPSRLAWLRHDESASGSARSSSARSALGSGREVVERQALRPQAVEELRRRGTSARATTRAARRGRRVAPSRVTARSGPSRRSRHRARPARTRGRCGAPRSRASGTARARRCCRRRRRASPRVAPRSWSALRARRSRARARARCPARGDRRRSRRSRRARDRDRAPAWSFSQLKPARPASSTASRKSAGSNHDSAMRSRRVGVGPAALVGVVGERPVVHGEPGVVVALGIERAHVDTVGPARRLRPGERHPHLEERAAAANPAAANGASSASVAPSTQHSRRPPPCAATCATAASSRVVVVVGSRAAGNRIDADGPVLGRAGRLRHARHGGSARDRSGTRPSRRRGTREVAPHRVADRVVAVDRARGHVERGDLGAPRLELVGLDPGARERHHWVSGSLAHPGAHGPRVPFARGPSPRREGSRDRRGGGARASCIPTRAARSGTRNAFELLAATILSAQCTDERVNMVTPALFARYPTPADLAHADPEEVEELDPVHGLLPVEDQEPDRDGAGGRGALRRRGPDRARRLRDAAGSRAARPATSCARSGTGCRASRSTRT